MMKPIGWIGSARTDLLLFPAEVIREVGHALYVAQMEGKHQSAKPLKGFGGAGVLEIVENDDGNAYRVVYTVRYREIIYVLHAFQKKSKRRIAAPLQELNTVRARLMAAEQEYQAWQDVHR